MIDWARRYAGPMRPFTEFAADSFKSIVEVEVHP